MEKGRKEVILPSFKVEINTTEMLSTYFVCQNSSEKAFVELNLVHNAIDNH